MCHAQVVCVRSDVGVQLSVRPRKCVAPTCGAACANDATLPQFPLGPLFWPKTRRTGRGVDRTLAPWAQVSYKMCIDRHSYKGIPMKTWIIASTLGCVLALTGCGGSDDPDAARRAAQPQKDERSSFWDLFVPDQQEQTTSVNRFIWHASLDVLDFLPVESVDPYMGTIVTGYGTAPGSSRAYRAVVRIDDPALDARSLDLTLTDRNGRVLDPATTRAVEDAILLRARQLRAEQGRL